MAIEGWNSVRNQQDQDENYTVATGSRVRRSEPMDGVLEELVRARISSAACAVNEAAGCCTILQETGFYPMTYGDSRCYN